MTDSLPSINLNLLEKLKDRAYRQRFFIAESSADIARQLVQLRKRRGLSQRKLASQVGMAQPRISQIERADYMNWSFNTLRRLAEAMDARIRVLIEPAEDILYEYEQETVEQPKPSAIEAAPAHQWVDQDVFFPGRLSGLIEPRPTQWLGDLSQHGRTLWRTGSTYGTEIHREQSGNLPYASTQAKGADIPTESAGSASWPLPISEVPNPGTDAVRHTIVSAR